MTSGPVFWDRFSRATWPVGPPPFGPPGPAQMGQLVPPFWAAGSGLKLPAGPFKLGPPAGDVCACPPGPFGIVGPVGQACCAKVKQERLQNMEG